MSKGTVKFFNDQKGFGFIIDDATDVEVFVHATAVKSGAGKLKENDVVSFDIEDGKRGPCAANVEKI